MNILNMYHSVVHFLISDGSGVQGGSEGSYTGLGDSYGDVVKMWWSGCGCGKCPLLLAWQTCV